MGSCQHQVLLVIPKQGRDLYDLKFVSDIQG